VFVCVGAGCVAAAVAVVADVAVAAGVAVLFPAIDAAGRPRSGCRDR